MSRFVALIPMLACTHICNKVRKLTTGQINQKLQIQIGRSHEENSRDFRSTFRSTIGIRDCEHQQATVHDSYTGRWSGGGHPPERWWGASPTRSLFSCSSEHNGGRDPGGPAHRTPSSRVYQSDRGGVGPLLGFPRDLDRLYCKPHRSCPSPGLRESLGNCPRRATSRVAVCRRHKQVEPCRCGHL